MSAMLAGVIIGVAGSLMVATLAGSAIYLFLVGKVKEAERKAKNRLEDLKTQARFANMELWLANHKNNAALVDYSTRLDNYRKKLDQKLYHELTTIRRHVMDAEARAKRQQRESLDAEIEVLAVQRSTDNLSINA